MEDIRKVILAKRAEARDNICKGFADVRAFGVSSVGELNENPFEKAAAEEEDDIEKSDIMNAFSNTDMVMIKKTGKEIKEQITSVVNPMLQTEYTEAKTKADKLLESCGAGPVCNVSPWWTNDIKIDVPYKVYDWEETYEPRVKACDNEYGYPDASVQPVPEELPKKNYATTAEEAQARQKYNDAVRCVCEVLVDMKAAEIMLNNLQDGQTILLNPRQAATLHFK